MYSIAQCPGQAKNVNKNTPKDEPEQRGQALKKTKYSLNKSPD